MELALTTDELQRLVASPSAVDDLAAEPGTLIVVTDESGGGTPIAVPPMLPVVVVVVVVVEAEAHGAGRRGAVGDGVVRHVARPGGGADAVAAADQLDAVRAVVSANPQASAALAVLLRGSEERSVAEGLHVESAVYGVLQAGPEHARWRREHPARDRPASTGAPVVVDRSGDRLDIVLSRPEVRNALDTKMRDALAAALRDALEDPTVPVELRGAGGSFCSGGDLDEMGSRPDPATAHLVRLARSPAWLIHQLAERTHVHVHGPCRGSGVELPAFAGRVTARRDTSFALPEVSMGLIPGAGGTVSLPRRIGRHRTALLALTGQVIDAPTALAWGLVDEVVAG